MESTKLQGVSHLHAGPAEGALAPASRRRDWSLGTPCRQQSTQDTPLSAVGCSVAGDVLGYQPASQIARIPEHSHRGKYPVPFRTPF